MKEDDVLKALSLLIENKIAGAFNGEVLKVDEDDGMLEVKHNDFTYDVKLRSVIAGSQFLLTIPKVGSQVFCVSQGNSDERYIAVAFNEVDKVIYQGENISLLIDDVAKKISFNGGELGGLVLAKELKKQLDKQTARIDAVIDAIKNGVPIAQDGGVGLQNTIKAALALIVNKEDYSSIENDKIVQ